MAGMIQGLFGVGGLGTSREDILSQIQKERMASNQMATQGLGKFAGLAQSGMQTAQMFGDQVKGMLGAEDPRLKKQSAINAAAMAVQNSGVDVTDPVALYSALYKEFMDRGLTQEATAIAVQLQDAKLKKASEGRAERQLQIQEEGAKPKAKESTTYQKTDGTPAFVKDGRYYDAEGNQLKQADLQLIPKDEFGRIMARGNTAAAGTGNTELDKQKEALRKKREAQKNAPAMGKDPYFDPMPGDSADTLALKAKRRKERDAQRAKESSEMGGVGTEMVAP